MFCFSERNRISKQSVQSSTRAAAELVPLWKVYGFSRNSDGRGGAGVAKDLNEFQQQTKPKNMFCIYTNHVSPHQRPSSSTKPTATTTASTTQNHNQQTDNTAPAQQVSWNKRLMHRTRSAMM